MSLSLIEKNGFQPLAVIRGDDDKKLRYKVVYVSPDQDKESKDKSIQLKGDMKFQLIPNPDTERIILFIAGKSGCGKSYFSGNFIKVYKDIFPDNPIYVISTVDEDPAFDKHGVKRIMINESWVHDPIDIKLFENSLMVFDDIDIIGEKKIREAVYALMNKGLEIGRHYKISMVITNHLLTNGRDTRRILNESHYIVCYPSSGSFYGINYMLKNYMGFSTQERKKVKNLRSRWVCIRNLAPITILTENECYLLNGGDNNID